MIPFQYSTKKKKVPAKRKNSMKEKATKEGKARWGATTPSPPLWGGGPPKAVDEVERNFALVLIAAAKNLIRQTATILPCLPLEGKGDRRRRWMRWNVTLRLY